MIQQHFEFFDFVETLEHRDAPAFLVPELVP